MIQLKDIEIGKKYSYYEAHIQANIEVLENQSTNDEWIFVLRADSSNVPQLIGKTFGVSLTKWSEELNIFGNRKFYFEEIKKDEN